jgi:hypothetical protein
MGDKRQQVEPVKHHRQCLLAMPILVFKFVPLVFVHIEGLVSIFQRKRPICTEERNNFFLIMACYRHMIGAPGIAG